MYDNPLPPFNEGERTSVFCVGGAENVSQRSLRLCESQGAVPVKITVRRISPSHSL